MYQFQTIVFLLFLKMPEEEAFAVLVSIMQDYTMRELYKPDMFYLGLCLYQFECLIQVDKLKCVYLFDETKIIYHVHRNFCPNSIDIFNRKVFIRQCLRQVGS